MASQSGLPPTWNTASGLSRSIGILIPGVLTPWPGWRLVLREDDRAAEGT